MFKNKTKFKEHWKDTFQKLGQLKNFKKKCFPNFFIISPPKTGSTWLSHNLNCHPEIFIPDVKEIKYFSNHYQSEDIDWYLKYFNKGIDQKKGEASPSYAILPVQTIKLIKSLMPELKLVFLMRDPISRAWSHTKHSYKYSEANFKLYNGDFESISDSIFIENFFHEWSLAFGDYFGCLKRWLSIFSKEQFYVGFFEEIEKNPKKLLTEVFEHIGVHKKIDWSQIGISDKIFPGIKKEIPDNLHVILTLIYQKRTVQLVRLLKNQFEINIPTEWQNTLNANCELSDPKIRHLINQLFSGSFKERSQGQNQYLDFASILYNDQNNIFPQEFDNQRLATILTMDESKPHPLLEHVYRDFNIIYYCKKYYALFKGLGPVDLVNVEEDTLIEYRKNNRIFISKSIYKIKCLIIFLILEKHLISMMKKLIPNKHLFWIKRIKEILKKFSWDKIKRNSHNLI